jgi:hypothetical protein
MVDLPKTVLVDGSSSNKHNNNVQQQQQHHHRRNDPAAYAYWIANYLLKERNDDIATDLYYSQDQVLFVQDSHQTIYHPSQDNDINESTNTTTQIKAKFRQLYDRSISGFSCGSTFAASALLMAPVTTAATSSTTTATPLTSQEQDAFLQQILPNIPTVVPLCLGGHFMATVNRILAAPVHDWNKVVNALQNENNNDDAIMFMERLWAHLLS